MKYPIRTMLVSSAALALACGMMLATPLMADSVTVYSDLNSLAAVDSNGPSDTVLQTGDTTGFSFSSGILSSYTGGSPWAALLGNPIPVPGGAAAVSLGGSGDAQNSGFVESTFTLPAGFSNASIAGEVSADEVSFVFLNGHLIGQTGTLGVNTSNDAQYSSSIQSYFQAGVNTLLVSDINTAGPSGLEYDGMINYDSSAAVTPEPSSLLLLGSGMVGLAGMVRRKIGLRA